MRRVAGDARFANGAARAKAWYAGVDGAGAAARAIRQHLGRQTEAMANGGTSTGGGLTVG